MTEGKQRVFVKIGLLLVVSTTGMFTGCSEELESCGVEGDTNTCVCSDGTKGGQTCPSTRIPTPAAS